MQFNLKQTAIYQALRWRRALRCAMPLSALFVLGVLIGIGLVASSFSGAEVKTEGLLAKKAIGLSAISFIFALIFWELDLFFKHCLKKPKLKLSLQQALKNPEQVNFAGFLDFEAARITQQALNLCRQRQNLAGLKDALLYFLLYSQNKTLEFVLSKSETNLSQLKALVKAELLKLKENTGLGFGKIILEAAIAANKQGKERIGPGDFLYAFSQHSPLFQQFLIENDLRSDDILNLVCWRSRRFKIKEENRKWWDRENLRRRGAVARDFVSSYSYLLDKYSIDLREKIKKSGYRKEIVGHKQEIELVERILSKQGLKNALLVGQEGMDKYCLVEKIAQRAFSGLSPEGVRYKRIVDFSISQVASQTQNQEQAEIVLETCFSEALKAGNIILCLRDLHNFISPVSMPGVINISAILAKYLALQDFQIIALTTYADFHNIIERNSALSSLFEKVEVQEISEKETLEVLENSIPFFEAKYKRVINYKALREILKLSSRYLPALPFPEKANRLLDEAMSFLVLAGKDKVLKPSHIKKVVSEKIQVPLEELEQKEKETLLNLEDLIHQRLINQEQAVREVSNAMRRARAEVNVKSGPIGSFLFLGPTGVGKTETAKILTAIYFGKEQKMIRFDMSEFQTQDDLKRMIGTSQESGDLTTKIQEEPFSLILLDELEKAHKNVLHLFLQVLDEGWLTDGSGRKVDFRNTIIISTSNAGSALIQEGVKQGKEPEKIKEELMTFLTHQGIYTPEFLNRFDAIVFFKPLGKPELLKVAHLMLVKLANRLLDKGVRLEITLPLKEKIVQLSYSPEFGARAMQRVIQDKVENVLAKALLSGELKRGQRITIEPNNFQIVALQ